MNIPEDLYEHLIHSYCPYAVQRLDGAIQYARPDDEDWSSHDERQQTARELRSLAGAIGCVPLRLVCKRWRAIIDKHMAATHQSLFGVRPCAVAATPQLTPVDAADAEARFVGQPPSDAPDSVTGPWNAAELDDGTGTLVYSHAHRAAARRLHACLAWRSAALQRDYPDDTGDDMYFRGSLAWTGFLAAASHLPWRLDAHHIYIDRTMASPDEFADEEWPERYYFDGAGHWGEEMDALLNFARDLLPDSPLCHGLHVIQHLPETEALPAGERSRYDLMGRPTKYVHREGEPRGGALLVDEQAGESLCGRPPGEVLEGACLFSFRADGADSCTPDKWDSRYTEHEYQFGEHLRRRGGRAWRAADLAHGFARCYSNAEVVLDEVRFEHEAVSYARCEHCDPDGDEDAPRARNATAHLIFRLLTDEPGGRGASERTRTRAPWTPPAPESCPRDPWKAYSCMRLVISGTVHGLPCAVPVERLDRDSPLRVEREERVLWKMAELDAALPACPHAADDGGESVTVQDYELRRNKWLSAYSPAELPRVSFAESVLVRDEKELAEPLQDIYASLKTLQPGLTWGCRGEVAWADVRLVHAVLRESNLLVAAKLADKQELVPPRQALRASLRAMGFGEWDDERLTAAIKATNHRSWEKKTPVTFQNPWNIRFLRIPPSWPVVGVEQAARPVRSSFTCECARCRFDAACGRDQEARRIGDLATGERWGDLEDGDYAAKNRAGRACDALRAQLPLYTHAENPRHYDDNRTFLVDR